MSDQQLSGTWRVAQSTEPGIRRGATVRIGASEAGLRISAEGGGGVDVPWSAARLATASNGQVVIDTGRGTVWADPQAGASPAPLAEAYASYRSAPASAAIAYPEYPAGEGRLLVLYLSDDDGSEVDPAELLARMGADAASRAAGGWRLESMAGLPLRHAGQKMFGVEGSGYTTKAAIGCLYARVAPPAAEN